MTSLFLQSTGYTAEATAAQTETGKYNTGVVCIKNNVTCRCVLYSMDSSISKQLRPQDSIRQFKSTKDGPTGQAAVTTKGAEGGLRSPPRPKNSPPRPKRTMRRRDSAVKLARSFELEQLRLQIEELRVENKNLKSSFSSQQSVLASRDQEMAAKLMAKDQEILSKRQELSAREAAVEAHKATVTAKEATIHGLTRQLEHLQDYLAVKNEVSS